MRQVLSKVWAGGTAGFHIQRTFYGRGFAYEANADAHALLCLVEQGSYLEQTPHGSRVRQEGTVHFHPVGEPKSAVIGPRDAVVIAVAASDERLEQLSGIPSREFEEARTGTLPFLMRQVAACLDSESRTASMLMEAKAIELYVEFANFFSTFTPKAPDWFSVARILLQEGRAVTEVARVCEIHPASFARSFRRWAGCTPMEFSKRCRLDRAKLMLQDRGARVGVVAATTGFSDQSHLAKEFKRYYGISPREAMRTC